MLSLLENAVWSTLKVSILLEVPHHDNFSIHQATRTLSVCASFWDRTNCNTNLLLCMFWQRMSENTIVPMFQASCFGPSLRVFSNKVFVGNCKKEHINMLGLARYRVTIKFSLLSANGTLWWRTSRRLPWLSFSCGYTCNLFPEGCSLGFGIYLIKRKRARRSRDSLILAIVSTSVFQSQRLIFWLFIDITRHKFCLVVVRLFSTPYEHV